MNFDTVAYATSETTLTTCWWYWKPCKSSCSNIMINKFNKGHAAHETRKCIVINSTTIAPTKPRSSSEW